MNSQQTTSAASIRAGDRDALAQLFVENRERLLALAYRLTASAAEAEDAVQDAFVSTLRHHDQFRGEAHASAGAPGTARASTWLYRVTFNAALMRLRTRRRKRADSLDALHTDVAEAKVHRARALDDAAEPDSLVERGALRDLLDQALGALKPIDRQIVKLRFNDGLSTEEVAEATGLSTLAVKARLHRARHALKDTIESNPSHRACW